MKCTDELMIPDTKEECASIWGWSVDDGDAMLLRSNVASTIAVWGGSAIQLRWPKDEEVAMN